MFRAFFQISVLVLLALAVPPAASGQQPGVRERPEGASAAGMVAGTTSMDVLDSTRRLNIGDRLSYRVVQERRPPIPLMITDSGEVEVPLLGRVRASGRTCKELAEALKPMLQKEYFIHATVIIALDVASSRPRGVVYVTGQVRAQGGIDLPPDDRFTVSKAILRSGGFAEFADKRKVKLVRSKPGGGVETTIVNVDAVLTKGEIEKDITLRPEDRIIVPQKFINF